MNNTAIAILLTIFYSPLCATIKEPNISNDNFKLLQSSLVEFHNKTYAFHESQNLPLSLAPLQSKSKVFLALVTTWDLKNRYFTFNNDDDLKELIKNKNAWCAIRWYYLSLDPDTQLYINHKDKPLCPDLLVFRENDTLKVVHQGLRSKY